MDNNSMLENFVSTADSENDFVKEKYSSLSKKQKNNFKEKECKVISYNDKSKTLDVKFDGYGIRIKNVDTFSGDVAIVKYKGEIGKPNFEYKL